MDLTKEGYKIFSPTQIPSTLEVNEVLTDNLKSADESVSLNVKQIALKSEISTSEATRMKADVAVSGSGNAITGASVDATTKQLKLTKDKSFVEQVSGKGLSSNDYTSAEKTKLGNIAAGAEVNQNAFSNVKNGSTTIAANAKTDTLEIVASGSASVSLDATNKKITISATDTNTKVTSAANHYAPSGTTVPTLNNATTPTADSVAVLSQVKGDAKGHVVSQDRVNLPTKAYVDKTVGNYILTSAKGAANGVASLDSSGKVPSSQLPSYVDDVLEYDKKASFPTTGEVGKIYVAKDTNVIYRWGGSAYVEISASLAIGETASTAFAGNRGKSLEDHMANAETNIDKCLGDIADIQPTLADVVARSSVKRYVTDFTSTKKNYMLNIPKTTHQCGDFPFVQILDQKGYVVTSQINISTTDGLVSINFADEVDYSFTIMIMGVL